MFVRNRRGDAAAVQVAYIPDGALQWKQSSGRLWRGNTDCDKRKGNGALNRSNVICFTHYHGDHISGLPGLLLTMGNADRTKPLTLIGPKGLERVVNALRVIAPELPFQIKYMEITEAEQTFEMNATA